MEPIVPFVREAGQGPAVVCLHSNASSSSQWRALMERLSPVHRVVANGRLLKLQVVTPIVASGVTPVREITRNPVEWGPTLRPSQPGRHVNVPASTVRDFLTKSPT